MEGGPNLRQDKRFVLLILQIIKKFLIYALVQKQILIKLLKQQKKLFRPGLKQNPLKDPSIFMLWQD